MRRSALLLVAFVAVQLPWLDRPVHFDEANFLTLARGAALDAWRPHDIFINWQGTRERAFDVLSNPPGIAWLLAPLLDAPLALQRAWMLLWLPLAAFGAHKLGRHFWDDGALGVAVLLSSPIVLISAPSLLPDAPLYALVLAGVGGYVEAVEARKSGWAWALLAGTACLFRYSALPIVPLLVVFSWSKQRSPLGALAAAAPIVLLCAHDLHAYGRLHLLAMSGFQSVANTPLDVAHKLAAAVAMLGGAAALPFFRWTRATAVGAALGAGLGAPWGAPGALFGALGAATLATVATRQPRWLALWAFGGLLFLLSLRFSAARYWLPFLPGVLLALRPRWPHVFASSVLGVLLLADEHQQARAEERLALAVGALGTGSFTGHWGWQWALEERGWTALDEGATPARGTLVATPRQAWPQPTEAGCKELVWEGAALPEHSWLPRGYTEEGQANLHASWIAGPPRSRTIAPWWFADDAYESARVCRE